MEGGHQLSPLLRPQKKGREIGPHSPAHGPSESHQGNPVPLRPSGRSRNLPVLKAPSHKIYAVAGLQLCLLSTTGFLWTSDSATGKEILLLMYASFHLYPNSFFENLIKQSDFQATLASSDDKGKDLDQAQSGKLKTENPVDIQRLGNVETVTNQISNLSVSSAAEVPSPSTDQIETSKNEDVGQDIDKRIRALKKKIRLAEAQLKGDQQNMKPEQLEKLSKIEGWCKELKALEDKKANKVS
ncbi:uncharacterized protein A4U43_C07F37060 [Asparagus officinalis]|uniref:Uncharacterized protein n=2 Tax=Asparagus officinalis TaxID=4686 RepID=A0A5P1EHR1_ASPOF|nr:uncharacterized protein A4U43_C07F37060 [Asparagus officinalis]